jgi:hypothetical protein
VETLAGGRPTLTNGSLSRPRVVRRVSA